MPTSAKVIQDSISESGIRLTTLVLEFPRIVLAEFNTHRMFSRNASSSRAIPVEKQIERVENDPFIPTYWGANQKGMQAFSEIENPEEAKKFWKVASEDSIAYVYDLLHLGVHKQLANRLLEPFSHIQVVVTFTESENFFAQRLHPAAQPEIQELARVMKEAMESSEPKLLKAGEWHLPFITQEDEAKIQTEALKQVSSIGEGSSLYEDALGYTAFEIKIKISVARCARVSYGLNERGWGDIEKDLALYDMLASQYHMSPFEHIATPLPELYDYSVDNWPVGVTHMDSSMNLWSGNFQNWLQYRQIFEQSKLIIN